MNKRFGLLMLALGAAIASAAVNADLLVSTGWLASHLQDSNLAILHVGTQRDYDAGHIPGARLVALNDISVTDESGLRLEMPPADKLQQAFTRLGVSDATRVIVYAGNDSVQSATRVWFTLDYLGHGDRAALLDGGLTTWRAEGRAVSTDAPPAAKAASFTPRPAKQRIVDAAWLKSHLQDRNVQIVDARLPEFYSGANAGGMPRAGHIPGARNEPFSSLLQEGGKLKGTPALETALKPGGKAPALTVSYCHIGQQATLVYFAARYLGLDARLYDGSFQDWSRRPELPVEPVAGNDKDFAAKLDPLFAPLADAKSPGLAVLVRKDGRTLYERAFGARDLRGGGALDRTTNFRLASFTKQFTAMATMLLVHDGKLRYDQTLTSLFPDFPAYGSTITVRHLLTHTSGLPDYENIMEKLEKAKGPAWTATRQIQDAEVLELLKRQTAGKFAPGAGWSYSNSGFVVLGLIVAKVSGQPFEQFLARRIFEPLHMDHTVAFVNGKNQVANRAYGFRKRGDTFQDSDQSSTSATLGDGGIYSSLEDLAKWDDALANHTLLPAEEMRAALTPATLAGGAPTHWPAASGEDNLAPGKPVTYGFGWFLDPYQGRERMWHTGSTSGFHTVIQRFPKDRVTAVVLCNRTDLDAAKLALSAADVVLAAK